MGQIKALSYAWRILAPYQQVSTSYFLVYFRDVDFKSIVNVIPLEGGFCMVRPAPKISKSTF
jgi:hypothetical protein